MVSEMAAIYGFLHMYGILLTTICKQSKLCVVQQNYKYTTWNWQKIQLTCPKEKNPLGLFELHKKSDNLIKDWYFNLIRSFSRSGIFSYLFTWTYSTVMALNWYKYKLPQRAWFFTANYVCMLNYTILTSCSIE